MKAREVNFDGLVGPTHNYAGLSIGNVASDRHEGEVSAPRQAFLQGLEKMRTLARLGIPQGVLPPQERPHLPTLRALGFGGNDAEVLARTAREAPALLGSVCSASMMWTANAATVSPFADTADGRTHFTPANLISMFHRSIEPEVTSRLLRRVFAGEAYRHHPPLPAAAAFADEGAANHTRLCGDYGEPGTALFVYGSEAGERAGGPERFPARQTREAARAIARCHGLRPERVVMARQNPRAIDAGVFHNDVIAVGNRDVMMYHELAFADTAGVMAALREALAPVPLHGIEVPEAAVSLTEAVDTYLFNSQLVCVPGAPGMTMVAPSECRTSAAVHRYLSELAADHPRIDEVIYLDLRQSMNNGGGPACLRLRVVMTDEQIAALPLPVMLDDGLFERLRDWGMKHYRDRLALADLADPELLRESRAALDELTGLLGLGTLYEFQQV